MGIGTTSYPTALDTADDLVRATNNATTQLSESISSSITSIAVNSTALFPVSGIIRINQEIISYTGTSGGNTFTGCTRGFEGTTAASHSNNTSVFLDITAASNNVKNDAIIAIETKIGTGASTPTANTVMRGTGTGTSAYGQIVNGDVSASAAIAHSKLANMTAGTVMIGNASNVPTATAITGDITIANDGVTAISSGVILNADINASAAIAHSKLATMTSGTVMIGNASNVPTATVITGDVTVSNTGVTAISSGVIVDADINASAGIAPTKLNVGNGVATFLSTPSSANLAAAVTDETGTGALVFGTSPSLTTPNIGVATGTSFNSITGLSSTTPAANSGAGSVGTGTSVARADHVHPTTGLGLTSGGLDQFAASTSNVIGVGNIELGHASDTTLSRASAGAVNIEGVPIVTTTATQTLTNKTLSGGTLTGTLTAGGGVGTSGQALTSTGSGVQWSTISSSPVGAYNFFDNADLRVTQRPNLIAADGYNGPDRWFFENAAETTNLQYVESVDPSINTNIRGLVFAKAGTLTISQRIEALNMRNLRNQAVTASFYVYTDLNATAYVGVRIPDGVDNWTSVSSLSLTSHSLTPGVQRISSTFTANSINGLEVRFQVSSQANVFTNFRVGGFKLEIGSTATGLVPESYATNLVKCMRYYQRHVEPRLSGVTLQTGSAINRFGMALPVRMRSSPSISLTGNFGVLAGNAVRLAQYQGGTTFSRPDRIEVEAVFTTSEPAGVYVQSYLPSAGFDAAVMTLSAEL